MDAATDFLALPDGLRGNRRSPDHLSDIAAVIDDLPGKLGGDPGPICLVGTSRGTLSAAAYAAFRANFDGPEIDCVVLTSSITKPSSPPNEDLLTFDYDLEQISDPTLIVSHKNDLCSVTPAVDAKVLAAQLTGAPKVTVRKFNGGFTSLDRECGAISAHGFFGIEPKVIKYINFWIKRVTTG